METNFKEITGIVQSIREDRKALKLNNLWFSSFMQLPNDLEVGENIKLKFKENTKDGKTFKNIKGFDYVTEKEESKQEPKKVNEILASQLMSYSKDIFVALINNTKEGKPQFNLDSCVDSVINQFKKIRDSL